MRTVFRYEIPFKEVGETHGFFTLELPLGSIPLHVAAQQRAPHFPSMWILIDDAETRMVDRTFLVTGTGSQGHEPPASKAEYIGTFQDAGFVWHVWEARPSEAQEMISRLRSAMEGERSEASDEEVQQ